MLKNKAKWYITPLNLLFLCENDDIFNIHTSKLSYTLNAC